MAKDIQPTGPEEQSMFSRGEPSGAYGAQKVTPPDSDQADKGFAVSKPYSGDRSPIPPKADR